MANKGKRAICIEEGILNSQYTQEGWFVKVKPVISLDKNKTFETNKPSVLFAFVKKGTNGEGFDIYVDIDVFDNWSDDVLDEVKTFKKTIEFEKANGIKYPETYKYTTGNNGEKSVGFCPSTTKGAFCTVNGCTIKDGKKIFANVPVDMNWMRTTCKWFKRVTKPWFDEKAAETLVNASSNAFREDSETAFSSHSESETSKEVPNNTSNSNQQKKSESEIKKNEDSEKSTSKVKKRNSENINTTDVEIETTSLLTAYGNNGNYCIKAVDRKNKTYTFVILGQDISSLNNWNEFKKKTEQNTRVRTTISYTTITDKLVITNILF